MEKLIRLLHEKQYSCVIISREGEIRTFTQRGVADLYQLLNEEPAFLNNASIADKVIGKAAAALMIAGGVQKVYADIISQPALALFHDAGMNVDYRKAVDHIINRAQTAWCPLETICYKEPSVEVLITLIEKFINTMSQPQPESR